MLLPLLVLSAIAAEPPFDAPVIELMPVGEILADGRTPVVLSALILDPSGQPYPELELKFGVDRRPLDTLEALGGGLYRVTWVPPLASKSRSVAVEIRASTPARERLRRSWTLPIRPPLTQALTLSASPATLIDGDRSASLHLALGGAPEVADGAALMVTSSAGTPGPISPSGHGSYSAQLTIDDADQPRCVLVTAVDARDPAASAGPLALPQSSRRSLQLTGAPDSQLLVRLGDRERGPYPADAYGSATAELDLPPGVSEATVISLSGGDRSEQTQALPVSPTRRVQLFPLPPALPADPGAAVTLRAAVVSQGCRPDAGAAPLFSVSAGAVGATRHEGGGVYQADYTPPATPGPLTVTVSLGGPDARQRDTLAAALVDPLSGSGTNPVSALLLLPEAQRVLPNGISSVPLTALALDPYGLPVSDVALTLTVLQGDGDLPASVTTDQTGRAAIFYTAGREPGVISLMVQGGGHTANAALLQLPAEVAPALALPDSGSEAQRALRSRWAERLGPR